MIPTSKVIKLLIEYKEEHKDLLVPRKYCTANGIKLGELVHNIRKGDRKLKPEEREILNELGFVWYCQLSFEKIVKLLIEYKEEHGDMLVPQKYVTSDGIKLGSLVVRIRQGDKKLTEEEKAKLNEIGFVWACNIHLSFDELFKLLKEYRAKHGNLRVPTNYCTANGIKLGDAVRNTRAGRRKLSKEEKAKLNKLGFIWKIRKVG